MPGGLRDGPRDLARRFTGQALVIVDENDVLRDKGDAYARKLAAAGVPVTAVRYNGTIHHFMLLNRIADAPAPRGGVAESVDYLKTAFAR